ncbi:inorganic phosphate transporter [Curtobacterium sp. MCJR17_055]|uniref:inorganic phosphate transporter n=1 Tax=unclassified Curtobacterium TaxID=257496 RepID=UPI000D9D902B|nr:MULTISPECIES: inorganic phosphate transporter [unclassified Curtobacterium]PYY36792.1 inorganic phosphate transporter [Curtobacterium sp. MCBD17_029]PYY58096.1 inorganic phosphate transporter [Curtobacterium sp. MCPF17_015]PYY58547.1 inorganic phosphate transporter [Curtobacterium sp. MCJR17_055]WIB36591.1 inorganic phosphate transporter [Curtobacterium sp. MCJR17_043]
MDVLVTVVLVIVVALVFDFTNGFHDTANAMATSVATGALKPRTAVLISAVLNLVGAFLSTEVAKTVSQGLIREGEDGIHITPTMVFAGLVGAVLWNLATWYSGLPSSSTHALFGGLIGASVIGAGLDSVDWATVVSKVVLPALLSPVIAGVIALVATYLAYTITKNATTHGAATGFRHGQTVSASLVSLAHGTNDAQKTMGVITLTLIAAGYQGAGTAPELWVVLTCGLAIALGTYMGGWRIMKTVGKRISDVQSPQGFAAETSSAATILVSSHLGFALSTTHVTSGSVIGSGLGKKLADVHWGVVGKIVVAWVITLPSAAVVGGLATWIASSSTIGLVVVAVLALVGGLTFAVLARRKPIGADDVREGAPERESVAAGN